MRKAGIIGLMTNKKTISMLLIVMGMILMLISGIYLVSDARTAFVNPLSHSVPAIIRPSLAHYAFSYLKGQPAHPSQIVLDTVIQNEDNFTAYQFSFVTEGKRMTGQLNVPNEATPAAGFPVIVMLRGFVDSNIYTTGLGTRNAARVLASSGYITVAPDFFGYGESAPEDPDVMVARLSKPVHVIDLIASLATLSFVNEERLGMWGHSNGGQIALSVLEITGKKIPTTLWAPVSVAFPYSVLYYTNDSDDKGKALRQVLSEFEDGHDVFDYSIDQHWEWITAPIQLHHGTADSAAPVEWSRMLEDTLRRLEKDIGYYEYEDADHNLQPGWDTVVDRDLDFFSRHLGAGVTE